MSTDDSTPFPGVPVAGEAALTVIAKFEATFRRLESGRDPRTPTWCTFPACETVDLSVLHRPGMPASREVYFYLEGGRLLRTAHVDAVRDYFDALHPWEDRDVYLFDDSFGWCIAKTHELSNGSVVLLTGDLSMRPQG